MGILLAVCLLTFGNALTGDFVFDDVYLLQHVDAVAGTGGWSSLFRHDFLELQTGARSGYYRPLTSLSVLVGRRLYGEDPLGYHVTNLLLHFMVSGVLLALARSAGLRRPVAWGAAALFAVHPAHVEAVAWISGRADLLCTAFYTLGLWLFVLSHSRRSARLYLVALVLGSASLLSKEMALTLPICVALADALGISRGRTPRRVCTGGFWSDDWKGALVRVMPFVALVVVYLVVRSEVVGSGGVGAERVHVPAMERLLTIPRAFLYYLRILAWPVALNAYPIMGTVTRPLHPGFIAGTLALLAAVIVAFRARRVQPELAFGIGILLVCLAPLSNAVEFNPSIDFRFRVAERYVYLPSLGFVLVCGALLWSASRRLATARASVLFGTVVAVLCVLGAARSAARNRAWQSNDALFEATLRDDPGNPRAHLMLGELRLQQGDLEAARDAFETALRLEPRSFVALFELGRLQEEQGSPRDAVRWYEHALAVQPRSRDAHLGLARCLRQLGDLEGAAKHYAVVVSTSAAEPEVLVNQGELLMASGQLEVARRNFERALLANPRLKEAHHNMAYYHLKNGQLDRAEASVRRALALDPRYKEAHVLLGSIAVRRQDFEGAAVHFARGAEIDSSFVLARVNLGAAYLNLDRFEEAVQEFEVALEYGPSALAYLNLGQAFVQLERPEDAEHAFREALKLEPENGLAHRELGLFLAGIPGHESEARGFLQFAQDADGADTEVQEALERLGNPAPPPSRCSNPLGPFLARAPGPPAGASWRAARARHRP
ncbi:MAG: tetratricopeptide repeat protein, partial [Candidatus Krumholzibacteriia bacterium]